MARWGVLMQEMLETPIAPAGEPPIEPPPARAERRLVGKEALA